MTLGEQTTPAEYFGGNSWVVQSEPINPQIVTFALGLFLGLSIGALILMSRNN